MSCDDCAVLQVTTLESRFRVFDMRTQHPTEGFSCLSEKAHKVHILPLD